MKKIISTFLISFLISCSTDTSKTFKIDYEKFSLTTGLVHNFEKNSDLPSSSSLNKKTSDLVGDLEYNINRNLKMSYNYSVENMFLKIIILTKI